MPAADITVDQLQPYEKSTVVMAGGTKYRIKNKDAWKLEQGGTYPIRYEPSEFKGVTTLWIENVGPKRGGHPSPAPAPKPQNGVGFRPSMAPKDAQEARISLLCQAYAQAGIVPSANDVETLVMNVSRGVNNAAPKLASPQRADDMDDEIPY